MLCRGQTGEVLAMNTTRNRLPEEPGETAMPGPPDENSRLEEAMKRADDLLVSSLRQDDLRRRRRKRAVLAVVLSLGGVAMIATILLVLLTGGQPPAPPDAQVEKAGQLNQQGWTLWQQRNFEAA